MPARVLVIERDAAVRGVLVTMLQEAGHISLGAGDVDIAEVALRLSEYPLVVVARHDDSRDTAPPPLNEIDQLPPHAYILVSARPELAPRVYNRHTQHAVPVLSEPIDADMLLAEIQAAAKRLQMDRVRGQEVPNV